MALEDELADEVEGVVVEADEVEVDRAALVELVVGRRVVDYVLWEIIRFSFGQFWVWPRFEIMTIDSLSSSRLLRCRSISHSQSHSQRIPIPT